MSLPCVKGGGNAADIDGGIAGCDARIAPFLSPLSIYNRKMLIYYEQCKYTVNKVLTYPVGTTIIFATKERRRCGRKIPFFGGNIMIRSMTGFGRAVQEIDGYVITVELKSVNHRYFEFSSRVPRQYGFIEDKLKSFVNSRVSRGKVDCFVGIEALNTEAAQVAVNHTLAGAYNTALQEIADTYGAKQDWGAAAIARFPDVLVVRKAEEDEDKIWSYVQTVAAAALDKFVAMREVEAPR